MWSKWEPVHLPERRLVIIRKQFYLLKNQRTGSLNWFWSTIIKSWFAIGRTNHFQNIFHFFISLGGFQLFTWSGIRGSGVIPTIGPWHEWVTWVTSFRTNPEVKHDYSKIMQEQKYVYIWWSEDYNWFILPVFPVDYLKIESTMCPPMKKSGLVRTDIRVQTWY